MNALTQSTVLFTLQKRPYRFAIGFFLVILHFISGITTNLHFYGVGLSAFTDYAAGAVPLSFPSLLGALLWQSMLSCAVLGAWNGGAAILFAAAALGLESFVFGFSMSELLFHYGEKGVLMLTIVTLLNGMAGLMLRFFCFLAGGEEQKGRPPAAIWKRLLLIILIQGLLLPFVVLGD